MIVSHRHKFIFIAIPKTGTHAIRFALRKHMAPDDIEQVKLFVEKKAPYQDIAAIPHGHIKAAQIKAAVGEEVWSSYFKFACVRNPWDRFISYAFFMYRNTNMLKNDPLPALKQIIADRSQKKRILFAPQHEFVTDAAGNLMVDHICRQEDLQAGYDEVCKRIGIPTEKLDVINKSEHKPYSSYYDDELRLEVENLYHRDAELFNYIF